MHSLKLLSCLMVIGLMGCVAKSSVSTDAKYVQDPRTGLCFTHTDIYDTKAKRQVFSNVPCSPEVVKLLGK